MRKLMYIFGAFAGIVAFSTFSGCESPPEHTANWHYYWKDGNVVNRVYDTKWMWGSGLEGTRGKAAPHKTTDFIGLGDHVIAERTENLTLQNLWDPAGKDVQVEVSGAKGIDSVAITIAHEFKHVWVYQQWGAHIGQTGTIDGREHNDGDAIPDSVESDRTPDSIGNTYRFNPYNGDTYGMGPYYDDDAHYEIYGDNEILAREEGFGKPETTDPDNDWSRGGKQWGQ